MNLLKRTGTGLSEFRVLLFLVGYLWMVAIPYPDLGRTTYIDENALQPAQVKQVSGSLVRDLTRNLGVDILGLGRRTQR